MTKNIWRVDGAEKVSGAAKYAGDIRLPGLLVGYTLRSPIPHGRIKSIDITAARRVAGVHAVLTGANMPDVLLGKRLRDMPLLARARVRFIGEKVAVIAAESRDIAEEAAAESHTDRIARGLGMDPVKFRKLNVLRDGDEGALGGIYETAGALGVIERAVKQIGWSKSKKAGVGRGISLAERGTGTGRATVIIEVDQTGRAVVRIGVMEVGTGSHTVVREVVARVLDISTDHVVVIQGDTASGPFDVGSGGSKVTNTTGGAAFKAATQLRARLCKLAAEAQGWPEEQARFEKGIFFCAGKSKRIPYTALIKKLVDLNGGVIREEAENRAGRGKASGYACHAVEVAVDRETGQVRINRVVAAHDVGFVVNSTGLTGQIEGGFSQGYGVGLMEDLALDQGRLQVVNYGDYKIPGMADMPPMTIDLTQKRDGPGPFGAKGIGEIAAIPTAAAIANAVEDAVGVRITDLPITAEKVLAGLKRLKGEARNPKHEIRNKQEAK